MPGDHRLLCDAYLFLRRLESRMRIVANQSTSFLARDPEKLRTWRSGWATTTATDRQEDPARRLRTDARRGAACSSGS